MRHIIRQHQHPHSPAPKGVLTQLTCHLSCMVLAPGHAHRMKARKNCAKSVHEMSPLTSIKNPHIIYKFNLWQLEHAHEINKCSVCVPEGCFLLHTRESSASTTVECVSYVPRCYVDNGYGPTLTCSQKQTRAAASETGE